MLIEYIQSYENEKRSHSDLFIDIDDELEDYLNYILEKD